MTERDTPKWIQLRNLPVPGPGGSEVLRSELADLAAEVLGTGDRAATVDAALLAVVETMPQLYDELADLHYIMGERGDDER